MFGYVEPDKGELKVRELNRYKAFYCALCKSIGGRYSELARITLNYDCAFLALALCAVIGKGKCAMRRCGYKPFEKPKPVIEPNEAIDFAADVNVALAWNKLKDDNIDEKGLKRVKAAFGRGAFTPDYKKAKRHNGPLCAAIEAGIEQLNGLERSRCADIDAPADAFAATMRQIGLLAPIDDMLKRKAFAAMCAGLGRWIYLIDAWDDRADDKQTGSYNAFNIAGADRERAEIMLFNSIKEAESAYLLLKPVDDGGIIENILRNGCGLRTRRALGGEND